jgi:hypothetical protein
VSGSDPGTLIRRQTNKTERQRGAKGNRAEHKGELLKRLKWAAIAFVLWWVIQEPTSAAHLVHNIGSLLSQAAHGVSSFVANI